ncbi:hypothetical protein GYB22_01280 [bacterium]|nr:hypothetical protein [bacterium]
MKKLIFILLLTITLQPALNAQFSVGYYPFNSVLSLSSDPHKAIWGDIRLNTNTFFGNTYFEPCIQFNFKQTEMAKYYLGAGVNFNSGFDLKEIEARPGYVLNAGVRVNPIQKAKALQFAFELSPYINSDLDGGMLRTHLGLAYTFFYHD